MYYKYLADEHGRSKNGNLKYLDELKMMARKHRMNPTKAEEIFWYEVLKYDKSKYRFLRQKPINRFILDFYCPRLMLAIEIDGDSHKSKKYMDYERDVLLRNYSIQTIRYTNDQVLNNLDSIKNDLNKIIKEREGLVFGPLLSKGAAKQGI
jgi:very-short-patch-repair endonuclease